MTSRLPGVRPLLLIAALPLLWGATAGGSIEIAITGVRSAQGHVHVDVCDEASFLKDCRRSAEAPAKLGTTIVIVHDVPPGRYGAQAFHDRNANGEVDRGLFGIPLEGVGFSNDARIRMAPPKFADAAFQHDGSDQRISFRLRYFVG